MRKSCKYCGGIHDDSFKCPMKPKTKYKNKSSKSAFVFRSSGQWKRKREEIKERDKYLCRCCLAKNILTYAYTEVHHITPVDDDYDLRLDNDNLITLCDMHHKQAELGEISREELRSLIPPYLEG